MRQVIKRPVWDAIKKDWLSGLYTLKRLAERYKVSEIAVRTHSATEKWAKLKIKVEQVASKKIEERAIDRLARLGYSMDEHFQGLVSGMRTACITMFYHKKQYDLPDHRTRLEYQKELDKIIGLHAPVKQETKIVERLKIDVIGKGQGLNLDEEEKESFDNPEPVPTEFEQLPDEGLQ